jgi:hypothetical protein
VNEAYRPITTASERERQDLFVSIARRIGITEQSVEKDFWFIKDGNTNRLRDQDSVHRDPCPA